MLNTPKKYAFIGTSCIGKTTLINELKKIAPQKFPEEKIAFVPEAARMYFSANTITKNRFSYEHQKNIMMLVKQLEHAVPKNTDIIFCDRSILDAPSYLAATKNKLVAQNLLKEFQKWIKTYTHFFILDPSNIPYKRDTIRTESKKTRTQFHNSFLRIVPQVTKHYSLLSGNVNQRIEKVFSVLYDTAL